MVFARHLAEDVLGSVGSVVHQQQLEVLDVVDEESLVAGGGQEASLLVGSVANLYFIHQHSCPSRCLSLLLEMTYLGHADGAPEASADTAIDTLRLPPALTDTVEPVTLVTGEARLVCKSLLTLRPTASFRILIKEERFDSVPHCFAQAQFDPNCIPEPSSSKFLNRREGSQRQPEGERRAKRKGDRISGISSSRSARNG